MKPQIKTITFECSFYAESDKSICVFCIKGDPKGETWNTIEWFPKTLCTYSKLTELGRGTIEAPEWLLKKKNLLDKVTKVKKI